jgi:hypothetical protein
MEIWSMDHEDLLQLSHDHINGYIKIADQKASILLSGQLAFLALSTNLVPSEWGSLPICIRVLVVSTVLFILGAISFSILTVIPREESEGRAGYIFWNDILEHNDGSQFVDNAKKLSNENVVDSLGKEVYNVSKIAERKYSNLKISIYLTTVFLILGVLAAVLYLG